jgi:hypothetical protein
MFNFVIPSQHAVLTASLWWRPGRTSDGTVRRNLSSKATYVLLIQTNSHLSIGKARHGAARARRRSAHRRGAPEHGVAGERRDETPSVN